MRLLIVEDNEELAGLLAKGLKTAGYQCDVLSTVEDARAVLATTFYAALILDLGLPDGDGLELLREIRQRDNPVPVLVLTARGGLQDRVQDPSTRNIVESMRNSVVAMSALLNEILDISKLDAGTVKPQRTAFHVSRVLDRLRSSFANQAAKKYLSFRVRPSKAIV